MKRRELPVIPCGTCARDPLTVNTRRSECSHVECPHRRREPMKPAGLDQINGATGCYRVAPSFED